MNDLALRPSYWASVSGGKDSLFMLKLILSRPDLYPLDGVVHFELEIDYPFIKNVIDYMEAECRNHGIRFVRIRPRQSWYELYEKRGFPSRIVRWCNSEYKLDAAAQLESFLKEQGCYVVWYIGYCKDEESRYIRRKSAGVTEVYPLADFDIMESFILDWARGQSIFNDYYRVCDRCGCMFCPCQSRMSMAYLLEYYPEKYKEFMKMVRETEKQLSERYGRRVNLLHGQQDTDYIDNNVRTKWLKKLRNKRDKYKPGITGRCANNN